MCGGERTESRRALWGGHFSSFSSHLHDITMDPIQSLRQKLHANSAIPSGAMTPGATSPRSPAAESALADGTSSPPRPQKLAVLTSGGDCSGMVSPCSHAFLNQNFRAKLTRTCRMLLCEQLLKWVLRGEIDGAVHDTRLH